MATSKKGPVEPVKGSRTVSRHAGSGQFTTVKAGVTKPKTRVVETSGRNNRASLVASLSTSLPPAYFSGLEKPAAADVTRRSHDEAMAERYRKDPELAVETLDAILEDGDQGELLVTLKQIAMAKGVAKIAEETDINRTALYRSLSEAGNPSLNNLIAILKAMGLRLSIQAIPQGS